MSAGEYPEEHPEPDELDIARYDLEQCQQRIKELEAIIARAAELIARASPSQPDTGMDGELTAHSKEAEYIRALEDYADALAMTIAQRDWQPIETAPKDGAEILSFGALGLVLVRYKESQVVWLCNWEHTWDSTPLAVSHNPTHWMPLPTPPNPPAGEQGGAGV